MVFLSDTGARARGQYEVACSAQRYYMSYGATTSSATIVPGVDEGAAIRGWDSGARTHHWRAISNRGSSRLRCWCAISAYARRATGTAMTA